MSTRANLLHCPFSKDKGFWNTWVCANIKLSFYTFWVVFQSIPNIFDRIAISEQLFRVKMKALRASQNIALHGQH